MGIEVEVVRDLAVVMVVAALVTVLFDKFRQPIMAGYLIAGIIIGPHTPPFSYVSHLEILRILAELGIMLLLFSIGLEFPVARLRRVSKVCVAVALLEIAVMLAVGFLIASAFQWSFFDAIFLAAALSISSTAIVMKVLEELGILGQESSILMLGILIMEDIVAVIMIAALQSLAMVGSLRWESVILSLGGIGLLIGGTLVVGTYTIPKLIDKVSSLNRPEITLISALGLCFGLSMISNLLGFSVAIGAFLAGVLVAESKSRSAIADLSRPLKFMFAAVFFVSMGALMDFSQFTIFLLPAIIVVLATVSSKLMSISLGLRVFGYRTITALRTGLGMIQIGEFSFIIIALGVGLNVVSPFLLSLVGVVAIITSFLTPYLIRLGMGLK